MIVEEIEKFKNNRITNIQAAKTIAFNVYDPKNKKLQRKHFSFYLNKDIDIDKDARKLFPQGRLADEKSRELSKIVIGEILNDPSKYNIRMNYILETMMESIIESSKVGNEKFFNENKKILIDKITRAAKNPAYTDTEVYNYMQQEIASFDNGVFAQFNLSEVDERSKISNKLNFFYKYIKISRDVLKDVENYNNIKGDKELYQANKRINNILKKIEENSNEKLKKNLPEYLDIITNNHKKREKDELEIINSIESSKKFPNIKEYIEDYKQLSLEIERKNNNLNLSYIIADEFFSTDPEKDKVDYLPAHYFIDLYHNKENKHSYNIEIENTLKKIEIRKKELLDNGLEKSLLNKGYSLKEGELKKYLDDFGKVIEDNFINASEDKKKILKEKLDSDFKETDLDADEKIHSIAANYIKDHFYNKLENHNCIDVEKNLTKNRYLLDDKMFDNIEGLYNFNNLIEHVGNKKITANDAEKIIVESNEFRQKTPADLIEPGLAFVDHLRELRKNKKTNGRLMTNDIRNEKDIAHDAAYVYRKSLTKDIMLNNFYPSSLSTKLAYMLGNKQSLKELSVCAQKNNSSGGRNDKATMMENCIENFENSLKRDISEFKQTIVSMSNNSLSAFSPAPMFGIIAYIIAEVGKQEFIDKKLNLELELIKMSNHLDEVKDPEKKTILSAIYKAEVDPESKTTFKTSKEGKKDIYTELMFQEMMKTGKKVIDIEGKKIELEDLDLTKGNSATIIKKLIEEKIDNELIQANKFKKDINDSELFKDLKNKKIKINQALYDEISTDNDEIIRRQSVLDSIKKEINDMLKKYDDDIDKKSIITKIQIAKELIDKKEIPAEILEELKIQVEKYEKLKKDLIDFREKIKEEKNKEKSISLLDDDGKIDESKIKFLLEKDPEKLVAYLSLLKSCNTERVEDSNKKNIIKKMKENEQNRDFLQKIYYIVAAKRTKEKTKTPFERKSFFEFSQKINEERMKQYKETKINNNSALFIEEKFEKFNNLQEKIKLIVSNYTDLKKDITDLDLINHVEKIKNEGVISSEDLEKIDKLLMDLKESRVDLIKIKEGLNELKLDEMNNELKNISYILNSTSLIEEKTMDEDEIKVSIVKKEYKQYLKAIKEKETYKIDVSELFNKTINNIKNKITNEEEMKI